MGKRRTHCPDGRPLYRIGEIPAHLATVTMLKRMRRRPAEGQEPAGTLFYHGNRYAPLYEIAAAEQMPELTGKRAEAYARARICSRCGVTSTEPLHRRDRRRRLCPGCITAERYAEVRPSWLAGRWAAVAWAREVLADPRTALVHASRDQWSGWPEELYAATLGGQVLLDVTIWPKRPAASCQSRPEGSVLAVDVAEQIHAVAARRIVAWQDGPLALARYELHTIDGDYNPVWPTLKGPVGTVANGDCFGGWRGPYTAWRAEPQRGTLWPGLDGLTPQGPTGGGNARQTVEQMATLLRLMAADDHPDGPPLCPVLPPTGLEPCGAGDVGPAGVCPAHEQTVEEAP